MYILGNSLLLLVRMRMIDSNVRYVVSCDVWQSYKSPILTKAPRNIDSTRSVGLFVQLGVRDSSQVSVQTCHGFRHTHFVNQIAFTTYMYIYVRAE